MLFPVILLQMVTPQRQGPIMAPGGGHIFLRIMQVNGNITEIEGGAFIDLGLPPQDPEEDWLIYMTVE